MSLAGPSAPTAARLDGLRSKYKANTGVASPSRTIVLLYERLIKDIDDASSAIADRRIADAHEALIHAQKIVEGLDLSLVDDNWEGTVSLRSVYDYLDGILVAANVRKNASQLARCRELVVSLADAWRQAWAATEQPGVTS